jgi:hypothetical protein
MGHTHPGIVGKHGAKSFGSPGLPSRIELGLGDLGKFPTDRGQVVTSSEGGVPCGEVDHPADRGEIGGDTPLDPGAKHLEDHFLAGPKNRPVHLSEGSGSKGLWVHGAKRRESRPIGLHEGGFDVHPRFGSDHVEKMAKFGREGHREDVHPCGEELAYLDDKAPHVVCGPTKKTPFPGPQAAFRQGLCLL